MPDTLDEMIGIADRLLPVYRAVRPISDVQLENYFLSKRVHQLETRLAALEAARGD